MSEACYMPFHAEVDREVGNYSYDTTGSLGFRSINGRRTGGRIGRSMLTSVYNVRMFTLSGLLQASRLFNDLGNARRFLNYFAWCHGASQLNSFAY